MGGETQTHMSDCCDNMLMFPVRLHPVAPANSPGAQICFFSLLFFFKTNTFTFGKSEPRPGWLVIACHDLTWKLHRPTCVRVQRQRGKKLRSHDGPEPQRGTSWPRASLFSIIHTDRETCVREECRVSSQSLLCGRNSTSETVCSGTRRIESSFGAHVVYRSHNE